MIPQTNRTILFDIINPETSSLFNIMSDVGENAKALTDKKVEKQIHEKLLVNDFYDFLDKFKPTIYCYFDQNNQMNYELVKPTDVPKELLKEIVIDRNNQFLKTFISLIDSKRVSGERNISFDYEKALEMLSPSSVLEDIRQLKGDIKFLEEENAKYLSDSPEKAAVAEKLLLKYESTKEFYGEALPQLTLMIGMLKNNLQSIAESGDQTKEKAKPGMLDFNKKGEVISIPTNLDGAKKSVAAIGVGTSNSIAATDTNETDEYAVVNSDQKGQLAVTEASQKGSLVINSAGRAEIVDAYEQESYKNYTLNTLEGHFDTCMNDIYSSIGQVYDRDQHTFQRELVLAAFTDSTSETLANLTTDEKVELFNKYSELNTIWQKSFIRTAKLMLEKVLNIKAFFDQHNISAPRNAKMKPKLLIVNDRLENVVKESNLKKLELYLKSVNDLTNYDNTIWFGIVPDIEFSEKKGVDIDKARMSVLLKELGYKGDFDTSTKVLPSKVSDLQKLLDRIKNYKVQTFFSFEASEDTTFSKFAENGVDQYIKKTECFEGMDYSNFAIPCLPNLTVIPSDRAVVVLDKVVVRTDKGFEFSNDRDGEYRYWMYGVYISAAYVAAGIVAACQCPEYLDATIKNKVLPGSPGVRFDLEKDYTPENSKEKVIIKTTFAKEIAGITNEIRADLDRNHYGFVFSSDGDRFITIYKARCMYQQGGNYTNIFQETAKNYILRTIRVESNNFTKAGIDRLYKSGGIISDWTKVYNKYCNSIVREGDTVAECKYEDDSKKGSIKIEFGGIEEYIDLDIN